MQATIYNENDLPFQEMEGLGLASGRRLLASSQDLEALLCGRRTDLIEMRGAALESIGIRQLKAKLSLRRNEAGGARLILHPVYKKAKIPDILILSQADAKGLECGRLVNILTAVKNQEGESRLTLVEYDVQTREYIISDTAKIPVPEAINGEPLTAYQRELYREGQIVLMSDRTSFFYCGTDRNGMICNRPALVAAFLSGEVRTFIHFQGLNSRSGRPHEPDADETLSAGYRRALAEMENQQTEDAVQRKDKIESGPDQHRSGRAR